MTAMDDSEEEEANKLMQKMKSYKEGHPDFLKIKRNKYDYI
jgi:hypothetical protein